MSVKLTKENFRTSSLKGLKTFAKSHAKAVHYKLIFELKRLILQTKARKILLYMPLFYEADVYKIRRSLSKRCELFVPFMVGFSLEMVKLRLPFYVKKFNLREPSGKRWAKQRIDLAVVPVVGVDGAMCRIGHGMGFYDRFFSTLPCRPIVIFVQISENFTDKILSQKHDLQGDFYLTPNKNYIKRGKNDRNFSRIRSWRSGRWRRLSVCEKDK